MVGCPFDVPKYDYDNPFGEISKCELCNQKGVERLDKGELPGCCHVCPTGAITILVHVKNYWLKLNVV